MNNAANNDALRRTSNYDSNRDSYMAADGSYVYTAMVDENGRWVRRVMDRIMPDCEANIELIRMLDQADHAEDLQNRYANENADYRFLNQLNSKAGDDNYMDDTDAWAAIADRNADIEQILFSDEEENQQVEMVLAILEHLTESQINLLYEHFGAGKQLTEICDEENTANGTHKSPQAFGNRKRKLLNRVRKLLVSTEE